MTFDGRFPLMTRNLPIRLPTTRPTPQQQQQFSGRHRGNTKCIISINKEEYMKMMIEKDQKTDLAARRIVHNVCDIVIMRSVRLAAAGIVGILNKIGGEAFNSMDSRTFTNLHWNSQVPQQLDT
uniref:hexokinase n=1 Tax=Physcomitrium patens TaxID=3218 RepID=A0A7I4EDS2_PHYPA